MSKTSIRLSFEVHSNKGKLFMLLNDSGVLHCLLKFDKEFWYFIYEGSFHYLDLYLSKEDMEAFFEAIREFLSEKKLLVKFGPALRIVKADALAAV